MVRSFAALRMTRNTQSTAIFNTLLGGSSGREMPNARPLGGSLGWEMPNAGPGPWLAPWKEAI